MGNNSLSYHVATLRVRRVFREKWGLISWLAIPMIIMVLMSFIAGSGGGGKITGQLLITDHDDSAVSNFLQQGFTQGPLAEVFTVKAVSESSGQAMMDAGEASAWVTIEKGFGDAFLNSEPATIRLVKNPAQSILPQMVESSLKLLVDAATYVQLLFDEELNVLNQMLSKNSFQDAQLVQLTLGVNDQIERLEDTLFPPQMTVEKMAKATADTEDSGPSISFGLLMFPGALFMALLFSAISFAVGIWDDAKNGVIPRLATTPAALGSYFNGQMLAAVMVFALIAGVLTLAGGWYFELPMGQWPLMFVWMVYSGLLLWLLFAVIALLMPTAKVANIILSAATFVLMMLGGSLFPMESMPPVLAKIGSFLPNGFMLKALKDWMIRGDGILDAMLMPGIFALVAIGVLYVMNRYLLKQLIAKV